MAVKRLDIYGVDLVIENWDSEVDWNWGLPGVSSHRSVGITLRPTLGRRARGNEYDYLCDKTPSLYGNPTEATVEAALRYVTGVIARTGLAALNLNQAIRERLRHRADTYCADFTETDIAAASMDASFTLFVHKSQRKAWRERAEMCLAYVIAAEDDDHDAVEAIAKRYRRELYDGPRLSDPAC